MSVLKVREGVSPPTLPVRGDPERAVLQLREAVREDRDREKVLLRLREAVQAVGEVQVGLAAAGADRVPGEEVVDLGVIRWRMPRSGWSLSRSS